MTANSKKPKENNKNGISAGSQKTPAVSGAGPTSASAAGKPQAAYAETAKTDEAAETLRKYGDIIDLPHHQSNRHPHMSLESRAAQFAPFAALNGFEDSIQTREDEVNRSFERTRR